MNTDAVLRLGALVVATGFLLMTGCAREPVDQPAQQASTPAAEIQLDPVLWQVFKDRFVRDGRVRDEDNGGITHSESQGYGMIFAEAANDRESFDSIWMWTAKHLSRPDKLFSWRFGPCPDQPGDCITDPNNATDGEILIAWALLRAASRWEVPAYSQAAHDIAAAVAEKLVVEHFDRLLLVPGLYGFDELQDGRLERLTVNPSYWVFPALETFARAFPDGPWQRLVDAGRDLIRDARFGPHSLTPDWVDVSADGVSLSTRFDPVFGYNAVRVPLHLAWSSKHVQPDLLSPFRQWWSRDEGRAPAWVNLLDGSVAPYPLSTGMASIATLVNARLDATSIAPDAWPISRDDDGYFSWSLILLSRIAAMEI